MNYKQFLFFVSGCLLFQSFWMRDFSLDHTVYLPLLYHDITISGYHWLLLSYLYDLIGCGIVAYSLRSYIWLIPYLLADSLVFYAWHLWFISQLSVYAYGIIWNDLLYFVMLPSIGFIIFYKSFKAK